MQYVLFSVQYVLYFSAIRSSTSRLWVWSSTCRCRVKAPTHCDVVSTSFHRVSNVTSVVWRRSISRRSMKWKVCVHQWRVKLVQSHVSWQFYLNLYILNLIQLFNIQNDLDKYIKIGSVSINEVEDDRVINDGWVKLVQSHVSMRLNCDFNWLLFIWIFSKQ